MAWIINALEIADENKGTGKYRLTAKSDEDGGGPIGLCTHEHLTIESARFCPEAREEADAILGTRSSGQSKRGFRLWLHSQEFEDLLGGSKQVIISTIEKKLSEDT